MIRRCIDALGLLALFLMIVYGCDVVPVPRVRTCKAAQDGTVVR